MTDKLFEANEPFDYRSTTESYLKALQHRGALHLSGVSSVHEATWEERFAALPVRLLAIEAVERFGATLPDPLPEFARGYPYTRVTHSWYTYEDGTREYAGNNLNGPVWDIGSDDSRVTEEITWEIDDPSDKITVDMHFTPTQPVERITLSATVVGNTVDFSLGDL